MMMTTITVAILRRPVSMAISRATATVSVTAERTVPKTGDTTFAARTGSTPIAAMPTGWVPTDSLRTVIGTAIARAMTPLSTATVDGGGVATATMTGTMGTIIAGAISTTAVAISTTAVAMATRATTEVTRTAWARPGETFPRANPLTPILAAARIAAPSTTTGIGLATKRPSDGIRSGF